MKKSKGILGKGFMTVAALIASGIAPTPVAIGMQNNAPSTVNTSTEQKQAPITTPITVRSVRRTAIGTINPNRGKRILGTIPQKHAKRHTNKLHSRTKAKQRAKRNSK